MKFVKKFKFVRQ